MGKGEVLLLDFVLAVFVLLTIVIPALNLMGKNTQGKGGKMYFIIVVCLYVGGLIIAHEILLSLVAGAIFVLGFPLSLLNKSKGYNLAKTFVVTDNSPAPDTVSAAASTTPTTVVDGKSEPFKPADIDYSVSDEDTFINNVIDEELKKSNLPQDITIRGIEKRRRTSYIILSIAIFIATSLVFFHMSFLYVIGLVVAAIILFKILTNLNLKKYLIKQIKARPDENFSNIITSAIQDRVEKKNYMIFVFIAILLSMAIFFKPHIFYEKTDEGYYVRFYTMGLSNMTEATIPEEHNGLKVIGLRGNTFSNMFFLNKVTLPNTIVEIRGSAFENCISLKTVKLPEGLQTLGGAAFKGSGIEEIVLPDTLQELRGDTFKNCKRLKTVKLPNNIPEIRGNTFENCVSLQSISIPDSVTRIGGHAFYNNKHLLAVTLTKNSKLKEIGSSAFRLCNRLATITIPSGTFVNQRAFKESPTVINYFDDVSLNYFQTVPDDTSTTLNTHEIFAGQTVTFSSVNVKVLLKQVKVVNKKLYSAIVEIRDLATKKSIEETFYLFTTAEESTKSNRFFYWNGYSIEMQTIFPANNVITLSVEKLPSYKSNYKYHELVSIKNGDKLSLKNSSHTLELKEVRRNGRALTYKFKVDQNEATLDNIYGVNSARFTSDIMIVLNTIHFGFPYGAEVDVYYN